MDTVCAFLLQWSDKEYWGYAPKFEAVYLHKFCVWRKFAYQNMTAKVILAVQKICQERNVCYIRLDTGLEEKVIRKIYLKAGFKIVDIIDHDNGRSTALYELEI